MPSGKARLRGAAAAAVSCRDDSDHVERVVVQSRIGNLLWSATVEREGHGKLVLTAHIALFERRPVLELGGDCVLDFFDATPIRFHLIDVRSVIVRLTHPHRDFSLLVFQRFNFDR